MRKGAAAGERFAEIDDQEATVLRADVRREVNRVAADDHREPEFTCIGRDTGSPEPDRRAADAF